MNGIQQIGFAHAVAATNTYNAFCKIKLLMIIVFELEKRYRMEVEAQRFCVSCFEFFVERSNIERIFIKEATSKRNIDESENRRTYLY